MMELVFVFSDIFRKSEEKVHSLGAILQILGKTEVQKRVLGHVLWRTFTRRTVCTTRLHAEALLPIL